MYKRRGCRDDELLRNLAKLKSEVDAQAVIDTQDNVVPDSGLEAGKSCFDTISAGRQQWNTVVTVFIRNEHSGCIRFELSDRYGNTRKNRARRIVNGSRQGCRLHNPDKTQQGQETPHTGNCTDSGA